MTNDEANQNTKDFIVNFLSCYKPIMSKSDFNLSFDD